MSEGLLVSVGYGAVNVLLALALAPLCEGIVRKITARVQSRKGPPLRQPYYDLLKLLGKEDIEVGESPGMQRLAAYLSLGATLSLAALVPMGGRVPLDGWADAILLVYLLTLCGISTLLAGLAAGSPYSLIGASRGMMMMLTLEPILAVAVIVGAVEVRSLRLDAILHGSLFAGAGWPLAGIVMLGVMVLALQAFVERVPFDIGEAETEIMEGALSEYSGPKLALFKYARMVRLFVYSALFVALFSPLGRDWVFPLALVAFLAQTLVLVLLVTLIGATHARYRIDQAIRYFAVLLAVSVAALALAAVGF
jgi:formate hydrogenlyase subunit 4